MTASIVWSILYSWYQDLACSGQGLMWAPEPWSGAMAVVDTVWSAAHTTQFTKVGWWYIRKGQGSGYIPAQPANTSTARVVGMRPCGNGTAPTAGQRWRWNADGTIANQAGRCVVDGGGRVHVDGCDPADPKQRFAAPKGFTPQPGGFSYLESAAHPGQCVDCNEAATPAFVDTYACCHCGQCACSNENWKFAAPPAGDGGGAAGCGALLSATNMLCLTEEQAEPSIGSGSFVTLVSGDGTCRAPLDLPHTWLPPAPRPPIASRPATQYFDSAVRSAGEVTTVVETMANPDSTCMYGNAGWDDVLVGMVRLITLCRRRRFCCCRCRC